MIIILGIIAGWCGAETVKQLSKRDAALAVKFAVPSFLAATGAFWSAFQ